MKILCPACDNLTEEGAFCEMCGAPQTPAKKPKVSGAAEPPRPASEPEPPCPTSEPEPPRPAASGNDSPLLEVDRMCVQFEGLTGMLRFRLTPPAGGADKVALTLLQTSTGKRHGWGPRKVRETRELHVELGAQPAGTPVWTVRLEYETEGKRLSWEGDVALVVARPREALRVADELKVEITNHITLGNASDAHVNQRALDGLEKLAGAENPSDVLKEVVCGSGRAWAPVELYELSAPPLAAFCDRLVLSRGSRRLFLFAGPVVKFGRSRPASGKTDFTMRPAPGAPVEPYRMISGEHCTFARIGGAVLLRDGVRTASGLNTASKNGTWWEDAPVPKDGVRLETGATGLVSFAGTPGEGAVALRADRGEEWLLLRRTDGVEDAFLMLWGAIKGARLDAGAADGLELLRKDGAFAWRANGRSGWLVPGETAELPWGHTRVSAAGEPQAGL